MLGQLLESRPQRTRATGAAIFSAVMHLAIIGTAIAATVAQPTEPTAPPERLEPPIYVPPAPPAPPVAAGPIAPAPPDAPATSAEPDFVLPPLEVPVGLPPIPPISSPSLGEPVIGSRVTSGIPGGTGDTTTSGLLPTTAFGSDEVEKVARVLGTQKQPRYPEILRQQKLEGSVLASYVVGTDGRVEAESFRSIDATHPLFEVAVKQALLGTRFRPAEVGGKKVRQLIEQRFVFSLTR
ncbi:MAG: energy transducer TonB [Gemmatimonadaceae bacterium]